MPVNLPPALTKKIGPLPVWAWGAVALGLIGVYIYSRRKPADVSSVSLSPPDEGMLQADDGNSFEGLTGGGVGNLGGGTGPVYTDGASGGSGGNGGSGGGGWYPEYPSAVYEPTPPDWNPPGDSFPTTTVVAKPQPVAVTPTKQTSFVWAGVTYRKTDLAKFRAYLKKNGQSYATWAKLHPKAAMDVFGTMV